MSKIFEAYQGLPPWGKAIVVIGGLTGIYIAASTIYKRVNQAKEESIAGAVAQGAANEVAILEQKGIPRSYSQTQYGAFASELNVSFQGWGTDNDAVMNIFDKMKNDADVYALINAYGVRDIDSGSWNPAPNFRGDLPSALRDEMSSAEIQNLNIKLKNKGIEFQF